MGRALFVTGTDTGVGKTHVTATLGLSLIAKGHSVGVMKPVQCAGNDAAFLKKILHLNDPLETINPCFVNEPLSPHLAFRRKSRVLDLKRIFESYQKLINKYDILLIEGAGGLLVPLKSDYFVVNLVRDMNADCIVVSRLGLGTINHSLLTIKQAEAFGIRVKGLIFSETKKGRKGIPEETNPKEISALSGVPVLGIVPYSKQIKKFSFNLNFLKKDVPPAKLLQEMDKRYVWHPFTQMKDWLQMDPLVIDRAEGNYLVDIDGNKYLDGVSSLWVNVHGHRKNEIDAALKNQIDRISHSTLLGLSNTTSVELAKALIDIVPKGLAKVFYSDNGSTAVEVAIKMAYQYWQNIGRTKKTEIVHLKNSYHGDTLGSVSVGGIDLFHKVYKKLVLKTIQVDFDLKRFEKLIKVRHKQIACFVVEPMVQGAAGMILWPKGVLKRMRNICKKYDVIFIADEVATGFGRTGKMFACEHERIMPDILCLAKCITGGYLPLAATLTTQKIYDGFLFDYKDQKTLFHGHTYTGNPLACAAALANIKIFREERTLERLGPKIKYLAKRLKMFYNLPHVGEVRQAGFMVGIELVKDKKTMTPYPWQSRMGIKVCQKLRKCGIILRPLGNVIVFMPPLSITLSEIDTLCLETYQTIQEVTEYDPNE